MIVRQIFSFFIGLLPDVSLPSGLYDKFFDIAYWSGFVNYYIPVDTFVTCVGVFLLVIVLCWVVSAILQLF